MSCSAIYLRLSRSPPLLAKLFEDDIHIGLDAIAECGHFHLPR
jgi:hypothetical protein